MWIHVVCGAGASSTFVAQRLKRAAGAVLALRTSSGSLTETGNLVGHPDLFLLGAHLADHRGELAENFSGARVVVLPEDAGQDFDGSRTWALVSEVMGPQPDSA